MYSICTTMPDSKIDPKEALSNWFRFLNNSGEIIIATDASEGDSLVLKEVCEEIRRESPFSLTQFHIVRDHDNLIELARKSCKEPYVITLELNERLVERNRKTWNDFARDMENNYRIGGYLIPCVNIFRNETHYKTIDSKPSFERNPRGERTVKEIVEVKIPAFMKLMQLQSETIPFIYNLKDIGQVSKDEEEFQEPECFPHNLPLWK